MCTMVCVGVSLDFNYDGQINGSDYTLIDDAFNEQEASLNSQLARVTAEIAPPIAGAVAEPASLSVLELSAVSLRRRRKWEKC